MSAHPVQDDRQYMFGAFFRDAPADQQPVRSAAVLERQPPSGPRADRALPRVPLETSLSSVASCVVSALPTAGEAGVVAADRDLGANPYEAGAPAPIIGTTTEVESLIKLDLTLRDGPISTTIRSETPVRSGRLSADARWPQFGSAIREHHVDRHFGSVVSVPLRLTGADRPGILAVFTDHPDGFADADIGLVDSFGPVIVELVEHDRLLRRAEALLAEADCAHIINRAVGILISQHCSEEQALARLNRISVRTGQTVAEAAQMIVEEASREAHLRFIARSPYQR